MSNINEVKNNISLARSNFDNTKKLINDIEKLFDTPEKFDEAIIANLRKDIINFNFSLYCYRFYAQK